MSFKTTHLKNGIPVLLARYSGVETATIGISYNVGGRNEWGKPPEYDGISHFLEHQFFKGKGDLTPARVNERLDELGGNNNAFTTEDSTCYYAKVPKEDIFDAIDLWFDLLDYGEISQEEFDKESFVVRQELRRIEDTPQYYLYQKIKEKLFEGTSLEMTVIGNEHSLENVRLKDMEVYRDEFYDLSNAVLMVIGEFDEEQILRKLNDTFGSKTIRKTKPEYQKTSFKVPPESKMEILRIEKQTPLVYFGFALKTPGARSKYAEALELLAVQLSSGRSSLLEKNVIRKGVCNFAWAECELWEDVGNLVIVAGTRAELYHQAHQEIFRTMYEVLEEDTGEDVLDSLKDRVEYSLRMSLENPSGTLFQQAIRYWRRGKFESMEEQLERYSQVTPELYRETKETVLRNLDVVYGVLGYEGDDVPQFPEGTW